MPRLEYLTRIKYDDWIETMPSIMELTTVEGNVELPVTHAALPVKTSASQSVVPEPDERTTAKQSRQCPW